ncbi:hypothetical protein [Posidoniimonas polymericola]|uniref:hypothetical protein n=1 Tax=Posidoniimonas polymericola TaxID=2528002 RepID=UPI0018D2D024|nr:hypothetical protein [Posidoniimonas polymericola]
MVCLLAPEANSATVTDLVGDKDGFGVPGAPATPADGVLWRDDLGGIFFTDYRDADDLADAPFTDIWQAPGSVSYSHSYALGGMQALQATLQLQIAGIADVDGPYQVSVNSIVIGQIDANAAANAFQEVKLYSFNIPVALINGSDAIEVSASQGDGNIFNFSELIVRTVPEPTALALSALVLGSYGVATRRRIEFRRSA